MIQRILGTLALALGLCAYSTVASAEVDWLIAFSSRYPAATDVTTCGLCHVNFTQPDAAVNPYAVAFMNAGGAFNPNGAFAEIENVDSDGDGTTNIDEINADAGFHPGWTCATIDGAVNAPSGTDDVVDPSDPGCLGVTTTTTSSTTTTTLPGSPACAQPVSSGPEPVATDCLFILQAAVGSQTCSPECICAPSGTLPAKATDALLCLRHSVGDTTVPLQCPCGGGGDPVAGEQIYDTTCSFCHAAGAHDPNAELASDLAGKGDLLINDLSLISPAMTGITLTDDDIADLAAFLDGL